MSDQTQIERMTAEWRENTTRALERIEARLRTLEDDHNKQAGGIKVLLFVCAGISSAIGFAISAIFKHQ